jgi:hypothetical protein
MTTLIKGRRAVPVDRFPTQRQLKNEESIQYSQYRSAPAYEGRLRSSTYLTVWYSTEAACQRGMPKVVHRDRRATAGGV